MSVIRLSLDVTQEVYDTLAVASKRLGCSKSELLRRSVALYDLLNEAALRGEKASIALLDERGAVTSRVVGL